MSTERCLTHSRALRARHGGARLSAPPGRAAGRIGSIRGLGDVESFRVHGPSFTSTPPGAQEGREHVECPSGARQRRSDRGLSGREQPPGAPCRDSRGSPLTHTPDVTDVGAPELCPQGQALKSPDRVFPQMECALTRSGPRVRQRELGGRRQRAPHSGKRSRTHSTTTHGDATETAALNLGAGTSSTRYAKQPPRAHGARVDALRAPGSR